MTSIATEIGRALLDVSGLTTRFHVGGGLFAGRPSVVHATEDVSFSLGRGRIVGVVGESGSGKSTVGRTILRLETATAGSVLFDGTDVLGLRDRQLFAYRRRVQAIFQDPGASLDPRMCVGDTLAEPLITHGIGGRSERDDRVADLARQVGLKTDALRRYPHEFSGGQRQRIGIARALAVGPELIVADEPVSALDVSVQAQIVNLLQALRDDLGLALLFISHDLPTVEFLCDSVVVMYLGRVMEIAPAADFQQAAAHPYSRMLIRNVPRFGGTLDDTATADGGETPSPLRPPSGCVFRTRCPHAIPLCADTIPPLEITAPGRAVACIRKDALP